MRRSTPPRFSSHPAAVMRRAAQEPAGSTVAAAAAQIVAEDAAAAFLACRGFGPLHAERTCRAFRGAGFPSASWLEELEHMAADGGALAQFLISIELSLAAERDGEDEPPQPVPAGQPRESSDKARPGRRRAFGADLTNTGAAAGTVGKQRPRSLARP